MAKKNKVDVVSMVKSLIKGVFVGFSHDDGINLVTKVQERTPCDVAEILTPDGAVARIYLRTQELCDYFNSLEIESEARVLRTERVIKENGKERKQMFHDPLKDKAQVYASVKPATADALER